MKKKKKKKERNELHGMKHKGSGNSHLSWSVGKQSSVVKDRGFSKYLSTLPEGDPHEHKRKVVELNSTG